MSTRHNAQWVGPLSKIDRKNKLFYFIYFIISKVININGRCQKHPEEGCTLIFLAGGQPTLGEMEGGNTFYPRMGVNMIL